MPSFYLTQDRVGTHSGGGLVTQAEFEALLKVDPAAISMDNTLINPADDPFESDERFCVGARKMVEEQGMPGLCHFYAGCFTTTVEFLKSKKARVTYTCAAHDTDRSIEEFGRLGISYPFGHMSDPNLRDMYVKGYRLADVVIVPSNHSREIMKRFGCEKIVVIPHPVKLQTPLELPEKFAVGYFGQGGPDKGIVYLIEAWRSLDLPDVKLILGGDNSGMVLALWRRLGGKNIEIMGPVKDPMDFYRRISILVQPSVTEGYGIPVLEAMACGRPVVVSEGAGAVDLVDSAPHPVGRKIPIRAPGAIAEAILYYAEHPETVREQGGNALEHSKTCSWDNIQGQYEALWRSLISS